MDLFASTQEFAGWKPVGAPQKLSESSLYSSIDHITVVPTTDYGPSMCFFMKSGGQRRVFLSRDCALEVGDFVNPETVTLQQFERNGENCLKADGSKL